MTKQEIAYKNLMLIQEFDLYIIDNPAIRRRIPLGAHIALLPNDDPELADMNFEAAKKHENAGEPVVYVRIKKLRPIESRIEELSLKVARQSTARNRKDRRNRGTEAA